MAVRNCREIGENLAKIVKRLLANDNLIKLLYYTDDDPLAQAALTEAEKMSLIYGKLIRIIPRVEAQEAEHCIVAISAINGSVLDSNKEFRNIRIRVELFVPLTQWLIKSDNLRPFAILGELQESLQDKTVNGLGKLVGGDFQLSLITNDVAGYEQTYNIITYD